MDYEFETYEIRQARENVRKDLQPFFDAVVKEIARHVPEKGYGYKDPDAQKFMIPHLGEISWQVYKMVRNTGVIRSVEDGIAIGDNPGELLDLTAMAAFVWSHLRGVWTINNGGDGKP